MFLLVMLGFVGLNGFWSENFFFEVFEILFLGLWVWFWRFCLSGGLILGFWWKLLCLCYEDRAVVGIPDIRSRGRSMGNSPRTPDQTLLPSSLPIPSLNKH